jgi:hypothetical protein
MSCFLTEEDTYLLCTRYVRSYRTLFSPNAIYETGNTEIGIFYPMADSRTRPSNLGAIFYFYIQRWLLSVF